MKSNIAFEVLFNFKNLLIFQNLIAFWVSISKTLSTAIAKAKQQTDKWRRNLSHQNKF